MRLPIWGLESSRRYHGLQGADADGWSTPRRQVVVRQSVRRREAPGKTLSLFADDSDIQGWRYSALVTSLELPMQGVWRSYRGRADCENRIKALKADFGLDGFINRPLNSLVSSFPRKREPLDRAANPVRQLGFRLRGSDDICGPLGGRSPSHWVN